MPYYAGLRREPEEIRKRTCEGLARLRSQLSSAKIPARTVDDTVLLGTWNLREFDSAKFGPRTTECFYYIAEIVSRFDLVAIQEVNEDLSALERLKTLLGTWWQYVVTDVTAGASGNGERLAFLYDGRKVRFDGLAGEIVLPDPRPKPGEPKERALQFARTPFQCGFRAGWSSFNLCTVHIYYGKDDPVDPRRVEEIRSLASFLADRAKSTPAPIANAGAQRASTRGQGQNLILLGDFNIFNHGDATMKALEDAGFVIAPEHRGGPGSNVAGDKHFDQIAWYPKQHRFGATGRAGVFDFYQSVFRAEDEAVYAPLMGTGYAEKDGAKKKTTYYREWRTHQMSDHQLLWLELDVGYADEYLASLHSP